MVTLIIVCIVLLIFSLLFSRGRWYAPSVLSSGVWLLCILAYIYIDRGAHNFHSNTISVLITWMVCFCGATWVMQSLHIKPLMHNVSTSVSARDIYYYFSLLTLPFLLYDVIMILQQVSINDTFSALRSANVSETKQGIRTTGFFVIFWLVSYLLELYVANKKNIGRIIVLFLLNIAYVVISMGKINLLVLFLSSAIVLSYKHIIKLKHLAIGALVMCVAFIGIQSARGSYNSFEKFAALYLTSSITNFDTHVRPNSAKQPGENTFRIAYAVKNKIDGGKTNVVDTNLEFKQIIIGKSKYWSNTYTMLYPYYVDFGYWGIAIFGILIGLFYGYLFKTSEDGSSYALILYAILSSVVVLQFFADTFFMVLSQNIQYIIVAIIPYIISKYNLFTNLTKRNG